MKSLLVLGGCGLVALVAVVAVFAFLAFARRRRVVPVARPASRPGRGDATVPVSGRRMSQTIPPPDVPAVPAPVAAEPPVAPAFVEPVVIESADIPFDPNATIVVQAHAAMTLQCISGALEGRSFALTDRGLYIGRDWAESQVVIEDPRVSKRHVWIGISDGTVVVVDQGSTNGTFINSLANRVVEAPLAPGDTLILPEDVARFALRK